MFNSCLAYYRIAFNYWGEAISSFKKAALVEKILFGGLAFFLAYVGRIFYGTFLIDHFSLFVFPYFISYFLFNRRGLNYWLGQFYLSLESSGPSIFASAIRLFRAFVYKFELWTFPLTLLLMWVGGLMPYFNLIYPPDVYFGIFPESVVGVLGNDFMWNGFLLAFRGARLVPLELIPTYKYFIFNIYAVLYWLSFIPVFMWGLSEGRSSAFLKLHLFHPFLWKERIKIIMIGVAWLLFDAAMILLVVWLFNIVF